MRDLALFVQHEQRHVSSGGLSQAQVTGRDLLALVQQCPDTIGTSVVRNVGAGGDACSGVDHETLGSSDSLGKLGTLSLENISIILPLSLPVLLLFSADDVLVDLLGESFVLLQHIFVIFGSVLHFLLQYFPQIVCDELLLLSFLFLLINASLS